MIINLASGIHSVEPRAKILIALADEFFGDYQCQTVDYHSSLAALFYTHKGAKEFIRWAKSKHKLTFRYIDIPYVDMPADSLVTGYELTEDENFTNYLLKQGNDNG